MGGVRLCLKANESLVKTKNLLLAEGFSVEIVSAGGSNTYYLTGQYPGITEVQVGSYVTMDKHNQDFGLDFRQVLCRDFFHRFLLKHYQEPSNPRIPFM